MRLILAANNSDAENSLELLENKIIRFNLLEFAKANKDAGMQTKAK